MTADPDPDPGGTPRAGGDPARVVVIGGGFAGIECVKRLAGAPVTITLLDRMNHHLFQPLLYQVATAGLAAPDVAMPLRAMFRGRPEVTVLLEEVVGIDRGSRQVETTTGCHGYDFLVVAAGAVNHWFGHPEWERHAPGLKTLDDAFEIRGRILSAFEAAERIEEDGSRTPWLTFVVIGGGPTGVELAGAVSEIARHTMARDFRRFDPASARVVLVEGGPRILPAFAPASSEAAVRQLVELGVEVRTGARVSGIDEAGVDLEGERIATRTVLWGAGVRAHPLGAGLGVAVDRMGRVPVGPDLSVPGHPEILVAGDLAAVAHGEGFVPGVAPAAMQMGSHAAAVIRAALGGRERPVFGYRDKGSMATIGRSRAVAELGRTKLHGLPAWLAWLLVHLLFLIGFRNRLVVLFEWAWAWLTYQRSARVVLGSRQRHQRAG